MITDKTIWNCRSYFLCLSFNVSHICWILPRQGVHFAESFYEERNGSYGRSKETLWHCYGFYVFAQGSASKGGQLWPLFLSASCKIGWNIAKDANNLFWKVSLQFLWHFYPRTGLQGGALLTPINNVYSIISCQHHILMSSVIDIIGKNCAFFNQNY